ncbi:myrosinase 1-like [Aricia agestis]|uniref:myrosinase 1-like n=1 Tax=Aricia agestis TaxID=91739 RepID=UPI001C2028C6|nr:myrosinase 1-like [Aricia agestis]
MLHALLLRLAVALSVTLVVGGHHPHKFPPNFRFGAATSSYQIEGGWDADGKGESIWDRYGHRRQSAIRDNSTGDVAADSYHRWRDDVEVAASLGLHFYRFSISWPRILPSGFSGNVNRAGVRYYSELIDGLLARGIEPVVTMYHWDLPVAIQDMGGWTNPLIVKWFSSYARVLFAEFGSRVRTWITINEAVVVCDFNYNLGSFAPGVREPELAPYLCNRHVLLAHAAAYRIYERDYKPKYNGKISLANNLLWVEPASPADRELAELGRQHSMGRYLHPIFGRDGGWPASTERAMLDYSRRRGYTESKLPPFSQEEKDFIKGTADFIGINYYTTSVIRAARAGEEGEWFVSGSRELGAMLASPPAARTGASALLAVHPAGLRHQLHWLRRQYGDVEMLITENGYSTYAGRNDHDRIQFINDHLEQVQQAMSEGVRVVGYTVWSMIDNFEWLDGYSIKFGLVEVDFGSPNRTRTARASAHYYRCVIDAHALHDDCLHQSVPDAARDAARELLSGYLTLVVLVVAIVVS